ncbi:hypothetical protein NM208_g9937 [Fusarium decemcellulare]|uniref:Uncharacterized protein n=1 Tax=Fusarium decemcellulare TaxID=57161 RepID=A0ACC1RZN7_9HYPO|nr:hypothetical protein NM208_g9937 [Fusarium decemcellulare]
MSLSEEWACLRIALMYGGLRPRSPHSSGLQAGPLALAWHHHHTSPLCPSTITSYLPNDLTPVINADVQRFTERCVAILRATKEWAVAQVGQAESNYQDRAMTKNCIQLLRRPELCDLDKAFLDSTPQGVKSLLGREALTITSQLSMKALGVFTPVRVSHIEHVLGPMGEPSTIATHYEVICRPEVTANFRMVAFFEVSPLNSTATAIAKQVIMLYLGTLKAKYPTQQSFAERIYSELAALPDFSAVGLNRALSLARSQHYMPSNRCLHAVWLKETGQADECMNCGQPAPPIGEPAGRRHGSEKPRGQITDKEMHQLWLEHGHENVCQNPACREPRRFDEPNAFYFLGPDSRCQSCWNHARHYGSDPTNPHGGRPAAKHQAWLNEGHDDHHLTTVTCPRCLEDDSIDDETKAKRWIPNDLNRHINSEFRSEPKRFIPQGQNGAKRDGL